MSDLRDDLDHTISLLEFWRARAESLAAPDPAPPLDLVILESLLENTLRLLDDPAVAALLTAPADYDLPHSADQDWRDLPRSLSGAQTDRQRSDLYQLAHDLDMHPRHLENWLKQQFGPEITLIEQLSFAESETGITILGARLAEQQGGA